MYNDLGIIGNMDTGIKEEKRPTLGGRAFPYPRRERTGRPEEGADF